MKNVFKHVLSVLIFSLAVQGIALAQSTPASSSTIVADTLRFGKLEVKKGKKQVFDERGSKDSAIVVLIDTLILRDRASLQFFGKKQVKLVAKHAEIGKNAYISGRGAENNASHMDLSLKFAKLGSLAILAEGYDANNGFRTHPNGDGGNVTLRYDQLGVVPQQNNKNAPYYLQIVANGGGSMVNASADVQRIMDQIQRYGVRMSGIPSGRVYSGSPGRDGKVEVMAVSDL